MKAAVFMSSYLNDIVLQGGILLQLFMNPPPLSVCLSVCKIFRVLRMKVNLRFYSLYFFESDSGKGVAGIGYGLADEFFVGQGRT